MKLHGKKVAILVAEGFEESEMTEPKRALEAAGAETTIVSLAKGRVKAWRHGDWGESFDVDDTVDAADPEEFDALLLPGGVMSPDKLRKDACAIDFVRAFFLEGKPVGAICHGPWTLIDAGVARGRRLTSFESIQSDLENAGATWVDDSVVVDHGLVTSRRPSDLPAFCKELVATFGDAPDPGRESVLPHNVNGSGAIHGELLGER